MKRTGLSHRLTLRGRVGSVQASNWRLGYGEKLVDVQACHEVVGPTIEGGLDIRPIVEAAGHAEVVKERSSKTIGREDAVDVGADDAAIGRCRPLGAGGKVEPGRLCIGASG